MENTDTKTMLNIWAFKSEIEEIVKKIANSDFTKLETNAEMGGVLVNDLQRVIKEYGCSITPLPDNALIWAETYHIASKNRLDVYLPLWTIEEGRSDLTLSVSCFVQNGKPFVEINDLRVL